MTGVCFVQSAGQTEHIDMTIKHLPHYYHCQHHTASHLLASDKNTSTYAFRLILKCTIRSFIKVSLSRLC